MTFVVREDMKAIVARSGHELAEKRLTWGRDCGDTSLLDPDAELIYILPAPSEHLQIPNWSVITPQDVAVVDLEGHTVEANGTRPTVELSTHVRIYQNRPDVRAIVHTHGEWTRVFAALRRPLPALMLEQFKYAGASEIRCATFGPAGCDTVALSVVECLGPHGKVALLASHGAVCVGSDMDEAMSIAEMAEDMARLAVFAGMLGDPPQIKLTDFIDEPTARNYLRAREL